MLSDINPLGEESLSDVEEEFDVWYEIGPWLLLLVLPLAALSFRRGWLFLLPLSVSLALVTPSQQTYAADFGPTVDIQINDEGQPLPDEAEEQGFSFAEAWKGLWMTRDQRAAAAFERDDHSEAARLFERQRLARRLLLPRRQL